MSQHSITPCFLPEETPNFTGTKHISFQEWDPKASALFKAGTTQSQVQSQGVEGLPELLSLAGAAHGHQSDPS